MSGSLHRLWACLLSALITMGVTACNQNPGARGDPAGRATAGAASSCDTSILKIANSAWHTDVAGKMWVVGELSNTSGTDQLLPQICVSIRTATGERTERRYAGPILLKAGEGVSFSAIIDSPPANEEFSLSFATISWPADADAKLSAIIYRDFSVSARVTMSPGDNKADIHGILTNTGGLPASNIFVAVGLYDKEDALVGVAKGKVSSLDILDPGGILTFTLVSSQLKENTTSFTTRIFVEGQITESSN